MTDDRVTCTTCQHYIRGKCMQAKAADLSPFASIEIGRDLATLPQRCPAYKERNE